MPTKTQHHAPTKTRPTTTPPKTPTQPTRQAQTAPPTSPQPWPTRMVHDAAATAALGATMRPPAGSAGPDTFDARMAQRTKIGVRKHR